MSNNRDLNRERNSKNIALAICVYGKGKSNSAYKCFYYKGK